jgi:DNA-binding transcriptional regulator YhcF (GntR family)
MIIKDPPSNVRAFAKKIGCSGKAIAHIVKELETAGLIAPRARGDLFLWDQALAEVRDELEAEND